MDCECWCLSGKNAAMTGPGGEEEKEELRVWMTRRPYTTIVVFVYDLTTQLKEKAAVPQSKLM